MPDFVVDRAPGSRPDPDLGGPAALAGDDPFIMQSDGKGWLFAPKGMVDGPLPTHYEPQESPVANALYPQQQSPSRIIVPADRQSQRAERRRRPARTCTRTCSPPTGSPSITPRAG